MFFVLQTALDSSHRSSLVYDEHYTFLKHGSVETGLPLLLAPRKLLQERAFLRLENVFLLRVFSISALRPSLGW